MKSYLLILWLFGSSCLIFAADQEKHPIDLAMERAMDKDPSTAGMVAAITEAGKAWDKEMNAAYQALKKEMKPDEWASLSLDRLSRRSDESFARFLCAHGWDNVDSHLGAGGDGTDQATGADPQCDERRDFRTVEIDGRRQIVSK